jgi:hypothetical protein
MGPSFSEYSSEDASNFQIITLNDVIREVSSADLAHFIDLEAFERCVDEVSKARVVVMPALGCLIDWWLFTLSSG